MNDISNLTPAVFTTEELHISPAIDSLAVGQWYWVLDDDGEWLGCVTQLGSNYAEISHPPRARRGRSNTRIHLSEMHIKTRFEPDAVSVIGAYVRKYQGVASGKLAEIKAITASLGINTDKRIQGASSGRELAVLSGTNDATAYKLSLIKASKEDLPALFEEVKEANEEVARWMSAELLPYQAEAGGLDETIKLIEHRIFNVSLYAGLTEEVVQIAVGEPAGYHDKLRIMQRMLYMDEECLANYKKGGMSFSDIGKYDAWLSLPENRDRILPFPRCLVAMRVRRNKKERAQDGTAKTMQLNFHLGQTDMLTFIYLRNGDHLYRLNCDFEFEELIFPENASFGLSEPMMAKVSFGRVEATMSVTEFEVRKAELAAKNEPHELWCKKHPEADDYDSPYHFYNSFNPDEWTPIDDSNVYFDECMKQIVDKMHYYNRIALIVQGLYDRSPVFHPHKPLKTWDPSSFMDSIELVYDGSNLLNYGEAPDFAGFHARCNASLTTGSIVTGQEEFWLLREGEKESNRIDRTTYSHKSEYRPKRFTPHGNEGPGFVSEIAKWNPRNKTAMFTWKRDRLTDRWNPDGAINTSLTVPMDELFNISAYKPGDFKQFYKDPRTRAKYVQWAPFFMAAEDYYSGHERVQKPIP